MSLKKIMNNVLVMIQMDNKEKYNLTPTLQISLVKGMNFNRREDYPSFAKVLDGDGLPEDSYVLIHHNASEKTYELHNDDILTEEEKREGYKLFSIPEDMVFCYSVDRENWIPYKEFILTLRIFKPYTGRLVGLQPETVKNRMYCTKGEWEGKCLVTLVNCDYQIIYHDRNNKEQNIIRTRHREVLATDEGMEEKLKSGEYLVGLSPNNCKKLGEWASSGIQTIVK